MIGAPMVTVFIPCYNADRFIAEAIDSVLKQTYQDFEVLVIDDGSTDNSRDILTQYSKKDSRIRVLHNKRNRGVGYTRNRGVREARGKYLATLDADDVTLPSRLEKEVRYLEENGSVGIVGGGMYIIDEKGRKIGKYKKAYNQNEVRARMFFDNVITNSASMYRLDIVRRHHVQYKDDFHGTEDYMFWCMLLKYTDAVILGEIFVHYRVVQDGLTCANSRNCSSERIWCIGEANRYMLMSNGIRINKRLLNYCLSGYALSFFAEEKTCNVFVVMYLFLILLQTFRKPYFGELKQYIISNMKVKVKNKLNLYKFGGD